MIRSLFLAPKPPIGSSKDDPLCLKAIPGLMTVLDVALYNSVEGELTASISSSHLLISSWLDVKRQSNVVLNCLLMERTENAARVALIESFARMCHDAACDAIERFSTDSFSRSVNLTNPFKYDRNLTKNSNGYNPQGSIDNLFPNTDTPDAVGKDTAFDTGRRIPLHQRGKDCWESPRLFCPDYCNFDDAVVCCHKLLRQILDHNFVTSCIGQFNLRFLMDAIGPGSGVNSSALSQTSTSSSERLPLNNSTAEREVSSLLQIICHEIPAGLIRFRASIEADADVFQHLYLLKKEYREQFWAFLKVHQSCQRAPSLQIVDEYLNIAKSSKTKLSEQRQTVAKNRLNKLLETPVLLEALSLEQQIEEFEIGIAKQLYYFSELARYLDLKGAHLMSSAALFEESDLAQMHDTLYRLKSILCQDTTAKAGTNQTCNKPESSAGIRPLLLDLQGIPRDNDSVQSDFFGIDFRTDGEGAMSPDLCLVGKRLDMLIEHLDILGKLCQIRYSLRVGKKTSNAGDALDNVSLVVIRGCAEEFDSELFRCQVEDWFSLVQQQRSIVQAAQPSLDSLAESIREAEIEVSLSAAPTQSLDMLLSRLQQLADEREERFKSLKETVEDVCLREMNLFVKLANPDSNKVLELKSTSAEGFFGVPLRIAGEQIPLG